MQEQRSVSQPYKIFRSASVEDTFSLGHEIADILSQAGPQPIALIGDLGSGKTTLAKAIIHRLTGVPYDEITSPTFQYASLFHPPQNKPLGRPPVAHCDLWRLSGEDEFAALGLEELLHTHLCLIEWPDRISSLLSDKTISIRAEWSGEHERTYTFFVPYKISEF